MGTKLFVSAVGIPPAWVIAKLHRGGVLYMVCGQWQLETRNPNLDAEPGRASQGKGHWTFVFTSWNFDNTGFSMFTGHAKQAPMVLSRRVTRLGAILGKYHLGENRVRKKDFEIGLMSYSILLPACANICSQYRSPMTGKPVLLVAGGGMFDGRSLAAALMLGASSVWVGTRFVTAKESEAPQSAKDAQVNSLNHGIRQLTHSQYHQWGL